MTSHIAEPGGECAPVDGPEAAEATEAASTPVDFWHRLTERMGGVKSAELFIIVGGRQVGNSFIVEHLKQRRERLLELDDAFVAMQRSVHSLVFDECHEIQPEQLGEPARPKNAPHGPQRVRKGKARRW